MKKLVPFLMVLVLACGHQSTVNEDSNSKKSLLRMGQWLFSLQIENQIIPFNTVFTNSDKGLLWSVINAEERINVDDVLISGDSIKMQMPIFHSRFEGIIDSDTSIHGYWVNASRGKDYKIAFSAAFGARDRFDASEPSSVDLSGKWEVYFSPDSVDYCKAVGLFNQNGNNLTGTFLTETGDYRYLQGIVSGDQMSLSAFDGSHAFLFKAETDENGELHGYFWSGNHWFEKWTAKRNESYELTHPDSLTFVHNEMDLSGLSFLDQNKEPFYLDGNQFKNKVLIVQITGSWCPNCADESRVFADLYNTYHKDGLEIVGVSYEKSADIDEAFKCINRFKSHIGVNYPFVYAGKVGKGVALKDFNMLSDISSFPTAIFVDRKGKIRKVHTGFYGPGTGDYHIRYKKNLISFIESLLNEPVNI